ncbi:MAG: ABC-2 transporter permease [Sporolactobacillus sp.]
MIALMLKDMRIQRKQTFFSPLFVLFPLLVINISSTNMSDQRFPLIFQSFYAVAVGFVTFIFSLYSLFNTEEGDVLQNRLLLSLPLRRRTIVTARYVMIGVWWLYISVFCNLGAYVMHAFGLITLQIGGRDAVLSLCVSLLLCSLLYPVYYCFNFKAAQLAGTLLFFLQLFFIQFFQTGALPARTALLKSIAEHWLVDVPAATVAVTVLSYALSLRFFAKKDF